MEKFEFGKRLAELRLNRKVSARDMSLSIGQSAGYINNVENGVNYPSMSAFFYICEYLNISPKDFFDDGISNPSQLNELIAAAGRLSGEQLDHLIAIAADLQK